MSSRSASANSFLASALQYLRLGWQSIPLQHRSKTPILKNWTEIKITEAQVQEWWTHWPLANIGVRTGKGSGIIVLDLDGAFTLDPQEQPIPITPISKTGSGGRHYFFKAPSFPVKGYVRLLWQGQGGIDLRGDRNQVCAPPSLHPNGCLYEWVSSPFHTPLAELPAWVLTLLKGKGEQPLAGSHDRLQIPQGRRNKTLLSLAGTMRYKAACVEAIRAALLEQNRHCCNPPLDEDEVQRIVGSVAKYEPVEH